MCDAQGLTEFNEKNKVESHEGRELRNITSVRIRGRISLYIPGCPGTRSVDQ
ncbi:hypothetical protein STEG23_023000, partial [Scotinomys teguina]